MPEARVLFVNHSSVVSGAEMVLLDLVSACSKPAAFLFEDGTLNAGLERRGVKVIRSRFGAGLRSVRRDSRLTAAVPLAGRMAAIVGELSLLCPRYDVIYANSQKAFVLGAIAAAMARRPLIWHLHDIISKAHFGSTQRRLQIKLANGFARRVLTPSLAVASAFVAEGGNADLTRVVPNGLEVESDIAAQPELRRLAGLPRGPLIGVFSRLAPWKGQHVVLRAVAQMTGVKCIVVGSPLFGEDAYAESLRMLVRDLDLADRVTFLGQRSDIPRLMRAVDVVVHPSVDAEPFGRTLVEGMLVGTPVIATDAGASREILAGGKAGILVPPGDSRVLADALLRTLARGSAIDDVVVAAQIRAREHYGVDLMRKAVAREIDQVATGVRS